MLAGDDREERGPQRGGLALQQSETLLAAVEIVRGEGDNPRSANSAANAW